MQEIYRACGVSPAMPDRADLRSMKTGNSFDLPAPLQAESCVLEDFQLCFYYSY